MPLRRRNLPCRAQPTARRRPRSDAVQLCASQFSFPPFLVSNFAKPQSDNQHPGSICEIQGKLCVYPEPENLTDEKGLENLTVSIPIQ